MMWSDGEAEPFPTRFVQRHPLLVSGFQELPQSAGPALDSAEAVYVDGETSFTVYERDGVIRQYVHAFASVQA